MCYELCCLGRKKITNENCLSFHWENPTLKKAFNRSNFFVPLVFFYDVMVNFVLSLGW